MLGRVAPACKGAGDQTGWGGGGGGGGFALLM